MPCNLNEVLAMELFLSASESAAIDRTIENFRESYSSETVASFYRDIQPMLARVSSFTGNINPVEFPGIICKLGQFVRAHTYITSTAVLEESRRLIAESARRRGSVSAPTDADVDRVVARLNKFKRRDRSVLREFYLNGKRPETICPMLKISMEDFQGCKADARAAFDAVTPAR
jgi:hypothetical protein